jgi:hypothetical protein
MKLPSLDKCVRKAYRKEKRRLFFYRVLQFVSCGAYQYFYDAHCKLQREALLEARNREITDGWK